jgi:hypothetical protein
METSILARSLSSRYQWNLLVKCADFDLEITPFGAELVEIRRGEKSRGYGGSMDNISGTTVRIKAI